MVKNTKDNGFYYGEKFRIISELADEISNYNEYKERYAELISKNASNKEWEEFLINYYSRVIEDGAWTIKKWINENNKNIQDFSSEINRLEQINKKAKLETLDFEQLHILRLELIEISSKSKNKITLGKLQTKRIWIERSIGILIGIITSIIGGIIFKYFFK